jgi:four helix bundle protein
MFNKSDEVKMADQKSGKPDLTKRTNEFTLSMIHLYALVSNSAGARIIGRQFFRAGTSVGALYREAGRAWSDAEFISKMEAGLQELDETIHWLELLEEGNLIKSGTKEFFDMLNETKMEAGELSAIFVRCVKNVKDKFRK